MQRGLCVISAGVTFREKKVRAGCKISSVYLSQATVPGMFRIACREALHLSDIVRSHALARCPTTFWQLLVFRSPFCILVNFSSFLPILRYFFWPCFHISQCFSGQFMNFLWKRSQILPHPLWPIMGANACSRASRSAVFVKKIQNGGRRFTLD